MAEESWTTVERPILEAVRRAELAGEDVDNAARQAVPDVADQVYAQTIYSLGQEGCLAITSAAMGGGLLFVTVLHLLPKGRRAIGQWPSGDLGSMFVDELQRQIDAEPNEERKSKLRAVLVAVHNYGQDFAADVLAKMLKG
jgi:hypothetical protein